MDISAIGISAIGVAIASAAVAALSLIAVLVLWFRLRKLTQASDLLQAGADGASFIEVVSTKIQEVRALRGDIAALEANIGTMRTELRDALRHVAVVRYDAFGDMGGRLSFSAAILDDYGTGVVLTSIHGRTETRVYLKGVIDGASEQISPEERQAISHALSGPGVKTS
jgi:hypothetical protein